MKKRIYWTAAFMVLFANAVSAPKLAGGWQGILKTGSQELRLFLQLAHNPDGSLRAALLNLDKGMESIAVKSAVLRDSLLKLDIEAIQASFEGKLVARGTALEGTWTQGGSGRSLKFERATRKNAWQHIQYITVDKDVTLEVIDWGGSGRPLVLLSGLGNTAHIFDRFAPKLTTKYHVYGITRRGYGISSTPKSGYEADRLGDDVLAVIDALKLDRPVLAGHSIGGEELSSVGSRYPAKVAGLIYLDAAGPYAFYDPDAGELRLDLVALHEKIGTLIKTRVPTEETKALVEELLKTDLPRIQKGLEMTLKQAQERQIKLPPKPETPKLDPSNEIGAGVRRYTEVKAPVLAICALDCDKSSKAVQKAAPSGKFVTLANAGHYVFMTNEEEVLREMSAFMAGLPLLER